MDKKYTTTQLIKRFIPYFKPYKKTLFFDLFCALLTTVCEIVLPMIIRKITNTASYDITMLTVRMVLSLALLFIIGPAEEIFWRAYVQRKLADWMPCKPRKCMGLTLDNRFWAMLVGVMIYTLVHLFSFNFMLIMSALVCGAAWSILYWLFPNSLPAIILSHALWDAAVFIWFPIM